MQGVESSLDTDLVQQERKEKEKEDDDDDDWMRFQKGDFKKDRIPTERLIPGPNAEPILFYDDLVLFEDELADNGSSVLRVKVVSKTHFHHLGRSFPSFERFRFE